MNPFKDISGSRGVNALATGKVSVNQASMQTFSSGWLAVAAADAGYTAFT